MTNATWGSANQSNILEVEGLTKVFGALTAVDSLSFSVERGTIHGIIGPNGSGKSTTMRIIVRLLEPTSGKIRILGHESVSARDLHALIGYLPEVPRFPNHMTASELLDSYGRFFQMTHSARKQKIVEVLEMVDLLSYSDQKISSYTKGMNQRLGLAQTLIGDPVLLILDEPSSGLDPLGTLKFRDLLKNLALKGKAILLSSHILSEVEKLCNAVTILNRGKAVTSGRLEDLIDHAGMPCLELQLSEIDDNAIGALKSLPFVEDVRFEKEKIVLKLSTREDVREEVSNTIISCGGVILSMNINNKTMEDVFVHYVTTDQPTAMPEPSFIERNSSITRYEDSSSSIRTTMRIRGRPELGKDFEVQLDIVNVGSNPIILKSISELIPKGAKPRDVPSNFDFKDNSLRLDHSEVGTLETRSISLVLQADRVGSIALSPTIRYVGHNGEERLHILDRTNLLVPESESKELSLDSRKIFEYLKSEFMRDHFSARLSQGASGWRSLVQIAQGAEVSLSSLYGKGGNYGHALAELVSKAVAESRIFPKQRGRGGEVLKVRIRADTEAMRRELDRISAQGDGKHDPDSYEKVNEEQR